ncbi:MAG: response regulator transcription factor [Nocardioidaceae bacterium]
MTETATIRVLLAEDSYVVREGIRALIDTQDGLQLVGTCADLPALVAGVETWSPDVVLTDIRMPPDQTDEGVRAAQWLRSAHPGIGVVVLSQYVEEDYAVRLLEDGSGGGRTCSRSASETSRSLSRRSGRCTGAVRWWIARSSTP